MLSGRIEADEAAVAPKLGGRILEIRVREGDTVNAGDVIAVLDDEQVRAREDQAKAALLQAEARARAAGDQVAVLQAQLRQAQLHTEQSKVDAAGRVSQAEADLANAEAQLAQQQASYQLALFDKDAYTKLAESGAVSERQAKLAASTAEQQEAAVVAARRRVDAEQGALTTAKANLSNPEIREAETFTVRQQLAQQADGGRERRGADRAGARAARRGAGEPHRPDGSGAVCGDDRDAVGRARRGRRHGAPIVTLVDLGRVYLRGFVPEGRIGSGEGRPAGARLYRLESQRADRRVRLADRSAGDIHA